MAMMRSSLSVRSILVWSISCFLLVKVHALDTVIMYTDKQAFDAATSAGIAKVQDLNLVPPQRVFHNEFTPLGELMAHDAKSFGAGQMEVVEGGDVDVDGTIHLSMIIDGQGNQCEVYFPNDTTTKVFAFGAKFKTPNYGDLPSVTINSVTLTDILELNETAFRGFVSSTEITKMVLVNRNDGAAFVGMDDIIWIEQDSSNITNDTNSTATTTQQQSYLGCFQDQLDPRALEDQIGQSGFSVEECIESCANAEYDYAGRQWQGECFCGNGNYSIHGQVPVNTTPQCDCQGDNVGPWIMCVYNTSLF